MKREKDGAEKPRSKQPKPVRVVGLISDTQGLLRPEAVRALRGSDLIIHTGDVGDLRKDKAGKSKIIAALEEIAPVVAVRGNIDREGWCAKLPATAVADAGAATIYVLHYVGDLDLDPAAAGFQVVVSGHTHKPMQERRGGVLYINPGSAGPRRFNLPISLARLNLAADPWTVEFAHLDAAAK